MMKSNLLVSSLVALSLAASTQAMALNPQPEPPSILRVSTTKPVQGLSGNRFIQQNQLRLPPGPCRRIATAQCR